MSREHIIPDALGGAWTISEVCKPCNDKLGSSVDAALVNDGLVQLACAAIKVSGSKGEVPNPFLRLTLENDGNQIISLNPDKKSKKYGIYFFPRKRIVLDEGDVKQVVYSADGRDIERLRRMVNEGRRRSNLPALTDEQFAQGLEAKEADVISMRGEIRLNTKSIHRAFIKIAYELAYLLFGQAYLQDPVAEGMRRMLRAWINGADRAEDSQVEFNVVRAPEKSVFHDWNVDRSEHLGRILVGADWMDLELRIFDVYEGVIRLSYKPRSYPVRRGFIFRMNPVNRDYEFLQLL